jgi:hypothetical protein
LRHISTDSISRSISRLEPKDLLARSVGMVERLSADPRLGERQHRGGERVAGDLARHRLAGKRLAVDRDAGVLQPTNRLGIECLPVADLSGGSAKQNGAPSPFQVSRTSRSPALTVSW